MTIGLEKLIIDYTLNKIDKSGISELNLWVETQRAKGEFSEVAIEMELIDFINAHEMSAQGYWSAISYVIRKLELNSKTLADGIDLAVERMSDSDIEAFDLYSAWRAYVDLGGAFTPRFLKERALPLRHLRGSHWMDLAIPVFGEDYRGLAEEIKKLANERLISSDDVIDRYRSISNHIGVTNLRSFLTDLCDSTGDFGTSVQSWASEELEIELTKVLVDAPVMEDDWELLDVISDYTFSSGVFVFDSEPHEQELEAA